MKQPSLLLQKRDCCARLVLRSKRAALPAEIAVCGRTFYGVNSMTTMVGALIKFRQRTINSFRVAFCAKPIGAKINIFAITSRLITS